MSPGAASDIGRTGFGTTTPICQTLMGEHALKMLNYFVL
jgi:hypothetical protein